MEEDELVARTAVKDKIDAKEAIQSLRSQPFFRYNSNRGAILNNSYFGELADYLYYNCDWPPYAIRSRLKHYEGFQNHEWA